MYLLQKLEMLNMYVSMLCWYVQELLWHCDVSYTYRSHNCSVIDQLGCLCMGGWVGTFVGMCVSNFLFTLGLLPRMTSLRGWALSPRGFLVNICANNTSRFAIETSEFMWQGVVLRYARWIGELSHQSSDLSCLHNLLQKVVIRALLNTRFKGIQVVYYLTNCQTTNVMLTKVFPKSLGPCTWINKVHSSSRIYSYSTRGTDIAGVEGWWLNKGPNCSVPETQMTAPRLRACFPYILPSPNSIRDPCDIIWWHHNCLLYFFCGETTVHAQRKCHNSSSHPPALQPKSPVTITTPEPHRLFLIPNFMPVTLSPRYFSAPSYWSLKFFYNT